jgi:hypothetical protein
LKKSKISEIIKLQKEKEVHKHEPNFNLEAKINSNREKSILKKKT